MHGGSNLGDESNMIAWLNEGGKKFIFSVCD
jgi:hypothetical protein